MPTYLIEAGTSPKAAVRLPCIQPPETAKCFCQPKSGPFVDRKGGHSGTPSVPPEAPIRTLELPAHIHIALHRAYVTTVGELAERVKTGEVTRISSIGKKSAAIIKETLE